MTADPPVDAPPTAAVVAVVEARFSETVAAVQPFERGLNAVYRVDCVDHHTVVVKTATYTDDDRL